MSGNEASQAPPPLRGDNSPKARREAPHCRTFTVLAHCRMLAILAYLASPVPELRILHGVKSDLWPAQTREHRPWAYWRWMGHTAYHGPVSIWFGHLSEVNNTPGTVTGYWNRRWKEEGMRASPAAVEIARRDTPSLVWKSGQRAVQRSLF